MSFLICAILHVFALVASDNSPLKVTELPALETEQVTETIQISFSNESVVSEMQHTICSIKTEEVVAKAQSTASRILTGVCTSDEMNKAFKTMEKLFIERLEQVQQNLATIIQSQFQPVAKKKYKSSKPSAFKTIDYLFNESFFQNQA